MGISNDVIPKAEPLDTRSGPLTILHLSDLQFGANNRFSGKDDAGLPSHRQTLDGSLLADLIRLRDKHGLKPDLVVVTGDLAERARKEELIAARRFLEHLVERLTLDASRILVVPGNHDINRDLCKAEFSLAASEGEAAAPPFPRKWEHFIKCFFAGGLPSGCELPFYQSVREFTFTQTQPWTLFELPSQKVVVAGLNSTMVESHRDEDHYGWIGDDQLNWFAEKMGPYRQRGWLRLGAVHHNPHRGPVDDSENLRDADRLETILASHLDLLLHGHTHQGKLTRLGASLLTLATGSAALKPEVLPEQAQVPNQYQVIEVWKDQIKILARCYDPGRKDWIGDNRCSADGDDWRRTERVDFGHLSSFASAIVAAAPPPAVTPFPPCQTQILTDVTERGDTRGLVRVTYRPRGASEVQVMSGYRLRELLILTAAPPEAEGSQPGEFEIYGPDSQKMGLAKMCWTNGALTLLETTGLSHADTAFSGPLCGHPNPSEETDCCVLWIAPTGRTVDTQAVLRGSAENSLQRRRELTLVSAGDKELTGGPVFVGGRLVGLVVAGPNRFSVELVRPLLRDRAFAAKLGWPPADLNLLAAEIGKTLSERHEIAQTLARQLGLRDPSLEDLAAELLWTGADEILKILVLAAEEHRPASDEVRPGPVWRLLELLLPYCFDWAVPATEVRSLQSSKARVAVLATRSTAVCELVMAAATGRQASFVVCGPERSASGLGALVLPEGGQDSTGTQQLTDILVHLATKLEVVEVPPENLSTEQLEGLRVKVLARLALTEDTYLRARKQRVPPVDQRNPLCYVVIRGERIAAVEVAAKLPRVCIVRLEPNPGIAYFEALLDHGISDIHESSNKPTRVS